MSAFGKAFAAARKAGQKTFMWNGKSFHTRTAEEDAAKKPAALPKSAGREVNPGEFAGAPRASAKPRSSSSGLPPELQQTSDRLDREEAAAREKPRRAGSAAGVAAGAALGSAAGKAVAKKPPKKLRFNWAPEAPGGPKKLSLGFAKGGSVRGVGCAKRGHGKGRMV